MTNGTKFLTLFKADIVASCVGTGLFPSVMFCQMVLEGSGNKVKLGEYSLSSLAYNYNNFGGIKSWAGYTGKTVVFNTNEVVNGKTITIKASFCHFTSIADFCKWRTVFLTKNSRYTKYGVFKAKTPYEQMVALKKAGYATDPDYVNKLMNVYNTYGLVSLDAELKKKIEPIKEVFNNSVLQDILNLFTPSADSTQVYN
jgi:N-acetylmuramoyl-L-alanine amidase